MKEEENYLDINRKSWNNKVDIHLESEFYDLESFLKGQTSLNQIELDLLADIKGKSVLHLQCHFGQDTISLARLGAKSTGVDLSDKAIERARELAQKTATDAQFICADVYSLPDVLDEKFDIVFTSYGTIGWLPDLDKWAKVVAKYLKPEGKFILVEFHPVVWMFDDDFQEIKYKYAKSDAIIETESGTYAEKKANITAKYVSWNHSLSEVINSLIENGLEIKGLEEFDYSPYDCFRHTIKLEERKYRIKHLGDKIPMVYALEASKKSL